MKRAIILVMLAAATGACQRAAASTEAPAVAARPQAPAQAVSPPVPARLMARGPETRERIQPGRFKCAEPVASIPC